MGYNPIKNGDAVEWLGATIVAGAIGWATQPKWGIVVLACYVGLVLTSIAYQLQHY
jgi:hypothetical protein